MSNNKGMTMADIRLRKQQLKDDLDVLEDNFEERLRSARTNILKTVNLYEPIRKKPLRVVGMAIAAGEIVGVSRRKTTQNKSRRTDQDRKSVAEGKSEARRRTGRIKKT